MSRHILITGTTGFIGKVVLQELLRKRDILKVDRISVLIRPKGKKNAQVRFDDLIKNSRCFSYLPANWADIVDVVSGDLSLNQCGIEQASYQGLCNSVTNIVNCAASIEFNLPAQDAALANISSVLNVLELGKHSKNLATMVSVSTAYVARSGTKRLDEILAPLPRPAREIYSDILCARKSDQELLSETGHPNTYTLTKCLSEHFLSEQKGRVPLRIVRPSVVSACLNFPFPGWIDSRAAFARFVEMCASGAIKIIDGVPDSRLDIVPCDYVAQEIISAMCDNTDTPLVIRHAVRGQAKSLPIREVVDICVDFFREQPLAKDPAIHYLGPRSPINGGYRFFYLELPVIKAKLSEKYSGSTRLKNRALFNHTVHEQFNTAFTYFMSNTFDFQRAAPASFPEYCSIEFIHTVCRGVSSSLMRRNTAEVDVAGRDMPKIVSDFLWAQRKKGANLIVKLAAGMVKSAMRKCTDRISFNQDSFVAARRMVPEGHLLVIVPTHQSYLDFVLCSYLFFARRDLRISLPRIAAAEEFSKIPILGRLFEFAGAFYIQRGAGRENVKLTKKIHRLVKEKSTLEFFIEGMRSRARNILPPRRGLLRCIQKTGQPCTILPLTINYDRVPEERLFIKELRGHKKEKMKLRSLLGWIFNLYRGKVKLGRIHLVCGQPLTMNLHTDISELAHNISAELQRGLTTTTHHVRAFIEHNPSSDLDFEWLKHAIIARGGSVLESKLKDESQIPTEIEKTMRHSWMHLWYADALAAYPNHPAIIHHIQQNRYANGPLANPVSPLNDTTKRLLDVLFGPICRDYERVAALLNSRTLPLNYKSAQDIIREHKMSHLPFVMDGFLSLIDKGIVVSNSETGTLGWGPQAATINLYLKECAFPIEIPVKSTINQAELC